MLEKSYKAEKEGKKKSCHGEEDSGDVIVILVNAEKGEGEGTKRERDLFHIRSTVLTTIFLKIWCKPSYRRVNPQQQSNVIERSSIYGERGCRKYGWQSSRSRQG